MFLLCMFGLAGNWVSMEMAAAMMNTSMKGTAASVLALPLWPVFFNQNSDSQWMIWVHARKFFWWEIVLLLLPLQSYGFK